MFGEREAGDGSVQIAESDASAGPEAVAYSLKSSPETGDVATTSAVEYSLRHEASAGEITASDFEMGMLETGQPEATFVSAASASVPMQSSLTTLAAGSDLTEQLNATPGPVLLDFYADWCGPCKMQGKILHEMVDDADGQPLQVIKIDIDEHPKLAKKLQVKRLPTLMLVEDGSMVKRQTGAMSKEQLVQWMQSDE
ncbi:thioredoxin family protein [Roseimaritima ulvae]|uniref:thioredoxin family protein n=1 Tax=Roseimaritima ulvae TaxID=980254 RepID=UPI001EE490CE|nr:thioredoxin family protein [Roseimaritima ulvae]